MRTILHEPPIVVFDEPTVGVDAATRDRILAMLAPVILGILAIFAPVLRGLTERFPAS